MIASIPQHMQALEVANDARLAKVAVKRRLRSMSPADAMRFAAMMIAGYQTGDQASVAGAFRLGELLACISRCGPQKTRLVARRAGLVSVDRRLRDMTARERRRVALVLRDWPERSVFWRDAA